MLMVAPPPPDISHVLATVDEDPYLSQHIVDLQIDDDTLVVMVDEEAPRQLLTAILRKVWSGPIEFYCASSLMWGGPDLV